MRRHDTQSNGIQHNDTHLWLSPVQHSVIIHAVVMLSVALIFAMLSVFMLEVGMLSVLWQWGEASLFLREQLKVELRPSNVLPG